MFEIKGKYNTAKVFTDLIEESAVKQLKTMMDQEFMAGSTVRIMPDVHAGKGCTIGTTMTIPDKVCPNLVGVDIGCGMTTISLYERDIDLDNLDKVIREYVPSGFNVHAAEPDYIDFDIVNESLNNLRCKDHVDLNRARLSVGTLGGGNHFIEVDKDDEGHLYLVIHSGSRHLGHEIATYYQNLAEKQMAGNDTDSINKVIDKLKAEGRHREIADELLKLKDRRIDIPKDLAYLTGDPFDAYIHDMEIAQNYACLNRRAMMFTILEHAGLTWNYAFDTIHNYIDVGNTVILRKGAVSAKLGEVLLIPMNMRDGSLICKGKGNKDWNYSAPHGAGRLMSRAQAKKQFSVDEFRDSMSGIYTTSVGDDTLDECPMAYKPMQSIVDNISDTVEIANVIRPIYNFKAGL